jgi:long-subunit acyl-CoA synthetase (AMP-forming)
VEVWVSVVSQEAADWFTAATLPLLVQYCRHVIHARRLAEMLERMLSDTKSEVLVDEYDKLLHMQERESKAITLMARSMRLTQQANRNDNSKKKPQTIRSPWTTRSPSDQG